MLLPGTRIGAYEIVGTLGAGGMGEVYRARDARLKRDVAIKVLPESFAADAERRARFEREAETLAVLNHPGIAHIYGIEPIGETCGLVMELVEGPTLADRLTAGPVALDEGLGIATQLAQALAFAHERGVLHRDLKPSNIKLRPDGLVKLLDFGLAKRATAGGADTDDKSTATLLTRPGAVSGTSGYIAPEVLRGAAADVRSDLFALGVVLFELFTGEHPFRRPTFAATVEETLKAAPAAWPSTPWPVPELVQFVVRKAMAKDPRARYQSAYELRTDLEALAAPMPPVPAARRGLWIAAGVALVTVLTLVGIGLWPRDSPPPASDRTAPPDPEHVQLTHVGNVRAVDISPDGRSMVYVSHDAPSQRAQIAVRDLATARTSEIWRARQINALRWSPGGAHVLVSGVAEGGDDVGAWVVPVRGGIPQRLPKGVGAGLAALSPDGQHVASSAINAKGFTIRDIADTTRQNIAMSGFKWLLNLDWSPLNDRIAVLTESVDGSQTVWTVSANRRDIAAVYTDRGLLPVLRWSPTEDVIYVLRAQNQVGRLVRLEVMTPGPASVRTLLTGLPLSTTSVVGFGAAIAALSTDGRRVVYVRTLSAGNLWRVSTRGASLSPITRGTAEYGPPAVSPDGRWIATTLRASSGDRDVVKLPIAGGEPTVLVAGPTDDSVPHWVGDGRLLFVSRQDDAGQVWSVDAAGGSPSRVSDITTDVTTTPAFTVAPGGAIAWREPGIRNYRIRQAGNDRAEPMFREPIGLPPGVPRFSPQGDRIVCRWNRYEGNGLWIVDRQSRAERLLLAGDYWPAGWSPDGQSIYVYGRSGEIRRLAVTTGGQEQIATLSVGDIQDCVVTPDGEGIICGVQESSADVWMIDNFDPYARRQ